MGKSDPDQWQHPRENLIRISGNIHPPSACLQPTLRLPFAVKPEQCHLLWKNQDLKPLNHHLLSDRCKWYTAICTCSSLGMTTCPGESSMVVLYETLMMFYKVVIILGVCFDVFWCCMPLCNVLYVLFQWWYMMSPNHRNPVWITKTTRSLGPP